MGIEAWRVEPTWRTELVEHAAILEAIAEGNADLAASLTQRHISDFTHLLDRLQISEARARAAA